MIAYLFLSLLFCGAFAKTDDSIVLPKSLKNFHFKYDGTLKTQHGEIPVNGELYLSLKGNKLSVLDNSNLEWESKSYNVKNLILVDTKMKTKDSYVTINNKCLVSKFSKEKGTFPRFSEWKEIGNNKFEITSRNRFALKQILDSKLGKAVADRAEKTHDFRLRLILTLKKNKISDAVLKFLMDNKEVATKSIQVKENIEGQIDPKVFTIPSVCKSAAVDQQRKTLDLHMRLLGIDLKGDEKSKDEGKKEVGQKDEVKKEEGLQQTQGEVQESDVSSSEDEMKMNKGEQKTSESENMEKEDDNDDGDDENDDTEESGLDTSKQQSEEKKGDQQESELETDQQ